jgi:hypothetical protein
MKKILSFILASLCIALLAACGGVSQPKAQPAKTGNVKTVIKASALAAGLNIGGVHIVIKMPRGVAPALNSSGGVVDAAVEFISTAPAAYKVQKATYNSVDSVLDFSVIDLAGFGTEDQIIIHLLVSEGTIPLETDFSIKSYEFFDKVTGAVVTGLNPTLTTTIQ